MADATRVLELLRALLVEEERPAAPPAPAFMSCEEYAERIRSTAATVRELCREGMPHARPRPRMIRIKVAEADAWLEERSAKPRRAPPPRAAAQTGCLQ